MKVIDSLFFTNFRGIIGLVIGEDELTGERRGKISICSGEDEQLDIKMVLEYGSTVTAPMLMGVIEALRGKPSFVIYAGRRLSPEQGTVSNIVVERDNQPFSPQPSQEIMIHSPTGFNWGYGGSGPAQLALALLLDVIGDPEKVIACHQDFKDMFVSCWGDSWSITSQEILKWYKEYGRK